MIDEMAIRKHVDWDGEKFRGYVDIGTGVVDDSLPEAKDALVFMVVCINGSWKVPCGYFLIDALTNAEKANLVTSRRTLVLRLLPLPVMDLLHISQC